MNFTRHLLHRLAHALAGALPAWVALWRPVGTGPLFASAATQGRTNALPAHDQRTLRIGAQRCRWADAQQHDWPMRRSGFVLTLARPE